MSSTFTARWSHQSSTTGRSRAMPMMSAVMPPGRGGVPPMVALARMWSVDQKLRKPME